MMIEPGTRVRFTDKVRPEQFHASPEEWAANPKTGTVREYRMNMDAYVVAMDVEWKYNEADLVLWCQGDFEYMAPDEIEPIPS